MLLLAGSFPLLLSLESLRGFIVEGSQAALPKEVCCVREIGRRLQRLTGRERVKVRRRRVDCWEVVVKVRCLAVPNLLQILAHRHCQTFSTRPAAATTQPWDNFRMSSRTSKLSHFSFRSDLVGRGSVHVCKEAFVCQILPAASLNI
jgi:hypothetical protein